MHKLHTCAYFFCEIPTNFEKCFQKITVIIKTAGFTYSVTPMPSASRDLAMEMHLAVMYLLIVVPVVDLKIRQIYDSLIKNVQPAYFSG